MVGYSATPLSKKLGLKRGARVLTKDAPEAYRDWLAPLPPEVSSSARLRGSVDIVHAFAVERRTLGRALPAWIPRIAPAGAIWISWPKKSSKVETDIREDTVRELALPLGLVDVKVCAVSEVWSALKLVIRRELRGG